MKVSTFGGRKGAIHQFLVAFLVYLIGGFPTLIYALPQGGTISSGAGTIDTSGSSLTVTQTTDKIIINWESFSVGNNESVIFLQPDPSSSALNNVLGNSRTVVEGNLSANGQIVLSNPNGIYISPTANINVASLIASTLKISEQDFIDGLYKFSQDPSKPLASILNEGRIHASDFAALIAPSVNNRGVVVANLGTVGMVSGEATTIDFVGNGLIVFTIDKPVEGQVLDKDGNLISDRISNSGSIQADGGQVIMTAKNASSIIKNVINVEGMVGANTVTEKNGRIFLGGGDQGNVRVTGTLSASGEEPGEQGGEITVEGAVVTVDEGSIQAKGTDAKGGNITITGTDWVSAGGTMDVSGETGGNVNIMTGGLTIAAPILAQGTTGQGGNININTLFKSWEIVSALLDVSGASGGSIKHFADQQITTSGKYLAIGTDGKGGNIDVTANNLRFLSNTIDASGTMGGGRIRLGGEYQGGKNLVKDEIPNAQTLLINDGANVTAKTTGIDGDGGRIIAWGDRDALVLGHFDVTPGILSGAGGFVEVSSGDTLTFGGHVKAGIDERTGTLLLDPKNITIEDTRVFDPSSYMIGYGYSSDGDIDLSEAKLAFATLTVGNTAEALTVGETITGGTSGATGVVVLGAAGSTTVTYTVTSGTFQNETITGGTSSVSKVVSAVTASTTYRGNDDGFGGSVSLHGKWLAVGGGNVEDLAGNQLSEGAVFLYSYSDTAFSDGTLQAIIGDGYTGGNNYNESLYRRDYFGSHVSLFTNGEGNGQLVVSAVGEDGFEDANNSNDGYVKGGLYLYSFNDVSFAGLTRESRIGAGATGTNEIDLSAGIQIGFDADRGAKNPGADQLSAVSLSEGQDGSTRLAVGVRGSDGHNNAQSNAGDVLLFTFNDAADKDFSGGALAAVIGDGYDGSYDGSDGNAAGNRTKDINLASPLEAEDFFGDGVALDYDSTLNRHRLAVLSRDDRGDGNAAGADMGGVYLFTFTDDSFSGGSHVGTIGHSYSGTSSFDFQIASTKSWGGAMTSISLDGNYLAVGAARSTVTNAADGQVELFSFTNYSSATQFNTIVNEGTLCTGCSSDAHDVEVVPESGQTLVANDAFGAGVSLDGNRLVVGASGGDGAASGGNGASGEVHIFPITHYEVSDAVFATNSSTDNTIWPSAIIGMLENSTAVTLQANQDITVTDAISVGSGGATLTLQAGRSILINQAITTNNSALTLTANDTSASSSYTGYTKGTVAAGTEAKILLDADYRITTGTGNLTATIAAGTHESGNITLGNISTTGTTGVVTLNTSSTEGNSANSTLNATVVNAVALDLGASTVGGNLTATATTGNMTDSGVLAITGTSTFTTSADNATITLNNTNAFTGAVTITTNDDSGANAAVTIDGGTTALILAASTIDGDLTVTSGAAAGITDSGTVTVGGNLVATTDDNSGVIDMGSLAVTGTITLTTDGTGNATIDNGTANIDIAAATVGGDLTLTSGAAAGITDSGTVTVTGNLSATTDDSGVINLDQLAVDGTIGITSMNNVTIVNDDGINFEDTTVGGTLTVASVANNLTPGRTITGADSRATGVVVLGASGSTSVTYTKTKRAFTAGETITEETSNYTRVIASDGVLEGALTATATTGNIIDYRSEDGVVVDQSVLHIAGETSFTAADGQSVLLKGLSFFGDIVGFNASSGRLANVTVDDSSGIKLAGMSLTGNLTVTAGGGISQPNEALIIDGTSSFTIDVNNSSLQLMTSLNDFGGAVSGNGHHFKIRDVDDIVLGAIKAAPGQTVITAGGAVTQTGALTANGNTTITATGFDVTMNEAANKWGGATKIKGEDVSLTAGNSRFNMNVSTITGNLTLLSTHADGIIDAGAMTVGGTASFQTTVADADIVLNVGHAIAGTVTLNTTGSTGHATLDNGTLDLVLGNGTSVSGTTLATSVGGDLTVTSGNASGITDSGTVTVGGELIAITDANSGVINLGTTTIGGTITLVTEGTGDATLDNGTTDIVIGTSTTLSTATNVGGDLTLISGAAAGITDSATVTVGGDLYATTDANNGDITLNQLAVASGKTITLTTNDSANDNTGHATVVNANAVKLAASSVDGNLSATATTGNITQTGALTITGTSTLVTSADDADITLTETSNAFTGALLVTTNDNTDGADGVYTADVSIDGGTTGLIMGLSTIDGALTLLGGGTITDTGIATVAGALSATTDASNSAIILDQLAVDGTVALTTNGNGAATVVNDAGLNFAASTVGGNLAATATTGNMTDSGALAISGTTELITSANNATITLNNTNAFTGAVTITTNDDSGNNASATIDGGTTALIIAASTIDGDLTVTSGNASGITDSGTVTVGGELIAITDANSGVISLGTTTVGGTITLVTDGTGDATLDNGTTDIVIGTSTTSSTATSVGGDLTLISGAAAGITDSATVTVGGNLTATTDANNGVINLDTLAVTGNFTLTTHGTGSATIDNGTADIDILLASIGGALTLTSGAATGIFDSGTVTVGGNLSATTDANNGVITLDNLAVDTDGGSTIAFAPHGSGNVTIVNDDGINFAASTVGGNLTTDDTNALNVGETITGGTYGATGVVVLGANGSSSVTYTGTMRHITGGYIFVAGETITGGTSGNTRVIASSGVANGTLTATATTGNITQSGALTITGASSFTTVEAEADIDLATNGTSNNFYGGVSFTTAGSRGDVTVYDSNDFYLGTSTINGNLEVETANVQAANIGDDGIVTVTGTADLSASGTSNARVASIWMKDSSHIFGGGLSAQGHHVHFKFGADTVLGTIRAKKGKVEIISTGALTQTGPMYVVSDTIISAPGQDVTLDNAGNSFGGNSNATATSTRVVSGDEIELTAKDVVVVSNHSFNMGESTVSGNLTLTSGSAENGQGAYGITDADGVTVRVGVNFSATTTAYNGAIIMKDLAVDGTISLDTNGSGNATIENDAGLNFASSTVRGNLNATATTGNITQDSGALTVTGTSIFRTDADGSNIVLNSASNAFSSWVKMLADDDGAGATGNETFGDITFVDSGAVVIQTSAATDADGELLIDGSTDGAVGGNLSITATTGNITQGVALAVTGTSTFITGATGSNIILDHADNAFTSTVTMKADTGGNEAFGNITFVDSADVKLHSSASTGGDLFIDGSTDGAVGGNLIVTATTGNITQGVALAVTGTSTFTTSASDADITLATTTNAFTGAVSLNTTGSGGNAEVIDASALNLGASTVGGTLSARAVTGDISNSGNLAITGAATFRTDAAESNIALDSSGNVFSSAVTLQADDGSEAFGNITFVDSAAVDFDSSASANGDLYINAGTDGAVGGNLSVTATTGNITQNVALAVTGTSTFITGATGSNITLGNSGNVFTSAVTMKADTGGNETFGNITFVDSAAVKLHSSASTGGDLFIDGSTDGAVGGNLIVTATTGNITQGVALAVTGTSTFTTSASDADIILTTTTNAFTGAVSLNTTGGDGNAEIYPGTTNLVFGTSSVGGNLTVTTGSGSAVTQTGVLTVDGATDITANDGGNNIRLEGQENVLTGAVSLDGWNVRLTNAKALELGTIDSRALELTARGAITQTVPSVITSVGSSTVIAQNSAGNTDYDVTLENAANDFRGALILTAGNVRVRDTDDVELGASTVSGTYKLTTGGAVSDSGDLDIEGATTILASGSNVVLDRATHDFTGAVEVEGAAVELVDANAIDLGTSTVSGTYAVTATAGGDITDSGVLTITGAATFTAAGGRSITLDSNNTFDDTSNAGATDAAVTFAAVSGSGNLKNVTVKDSDEFDLVALTLAQVSSAGGNLIVTTSGTLTDSGALVIPGTTTITATGQVVDLDHTSNNFATITFGSSTNAVASVEVVDTNAIDIGASKSTGNFTVTAGGDVTDSGTITVGGDLYAITNANNGDVTLNQLAVTGAIDLATNDDANNNTGHATVVNATVVKLAASSVDGNLSATATTGNITQTGALTITGTSTLVTSADDADITLTETSNAFTGALLVTTNDNTDGADGVYTADVSIDGGTTGLIMGLSTIDGGLTLLNGETITDTGIATVAGTLSATTDASNKAITLDQLAVDGAFTLAPNGTGAVTIVNDAGLNLAASTMGGTFSGTATTGDISDSGNLAITDAATFITAANGSNIILDQSGNAFSNAVTMKAGTGGGGTFGNITFVDSGAVVIQTSADTDADGELLIDGSTDGAVGGTLTITATTGNITQGAAVTVTRTSFFTTSATDADITLSLANALTGAVTLTTAGSGGDAALDNGTTALIIAESTVRGDLTLTSGNASGIVDSGTITVGGDLFAITDANNGDITLDQLAVTGAIDLATNDSANDNTGHATVVNATAVKLAASSVDGNLSATATTGNITQTGALTVTGTTTLLTSADKAIIDLSTTTNQFTGALMITTNDDTDYEAHVTIDGGETAALIIAESTIDGDLTLINGNASGITDSGTVTIGGNLSATTDANNGDITLNQLAVASGKTIALTTNDSANDNTGHATVVNANAVKLAASSVDGNLSVTASAGNITQSGALTVTGTTTITASNDANITLNKAGNDFSGAVSTAGYNVELKDNTNIDLGASTVYGTYKVTAGDQITDSGKQDIYGNAAFYTNAASSLRIILDHPENNWRGTFYTEGGIGYTVTDVGAIELIGRTMSGDLHVTAGGPVTQSGAQIVGGLTTIIATGQSVTLNDASNDFQDEVRITGNIVSVTDTNGIDLGASTVSGTYTVTASGEVTDSGTQEITGVTTIAAGSGNNITLDYPTNNFAAAVKITSGNNVEITDEDTIDLGASTVSGTYEITATTGNITDSGTLEITGVTTIAAGSGNNITLDYSTNNFAAAVKITSGNNVEITDEATIDLGNSTVSGTYEITATTGNITDSGVLAITGNSTFTTSATDADIQVDSTTNGFTGTVTVNTAGTGGDAEIHGGSTPLKIIASGEVGTLKLTTTGADITDSGALVVLGATTIDAGGADVTLDHGSSNLQGAVGASGRNVALTHPTGIDLGDSTVTGAYDITATTGNITDTGALAITGLSTLVTSADGADITLDGTGHTFTGNVKVTTNETNSDKDAHATIDGGSTTGLKIEKGSEVQGDLTLRSGHANTITDEGDSGVVTVDGNLTATTYANNGSITLNDLAVDGTIALNTHGTGNATVVNDAGLQFAGSTVGGNLHATATTGNITQTSEALTITGTTTLITAASDASITLGTTSNAFTGALIITTNDNDSGGTDGDVTIHGGTTALILGDSTIDGDLALTSTAASTVGITDSGTLDIRGITTISASGVNVTLDSAANNFQAAVKIQGVNVTIVDAGAIDLGVSTVAGTYTVTAGGAVTDSGTLTITGVTTISASSGNVTLDSAANNFQAAVKIEGVNVVVVDANAIDLGASTVTGTYAVTATAGGDITNSGGLAITSGATFTVAGGQSITLDQSNTFSSTVAFSSAGTLAGVTITDSTDFDLQALTLSGNLVVASGGSITDSGVLAITGTSSFTTSTSNEDITLDITIHAFTGAVELNTTGSTGHATVDGGTTVLDIGASSVGGDLTLTSGHASGLTDSGTVTVGGNLVVTTDANNGVINMGTLAVTGSIALTTDGTGNATVVNASGLDFAASTIGGDLTATAATGNITDSGILTITGATSITLGTKPILSVSGARSAADLDGNTIALDTAGNLFAGGITLHYFGILPVIDNSDIDLARQVTFAELLWGLGDNTKKIYGAYEDIFDDNMLRMYELFIDTLRRPEKKPEEVRSHLPDQIFVKKTKTNVNKEGKNEGKEL